MLFGPPSLPPVPPQPPEASWAFVEELRTTPYHQPQHWRPRGARQGEAGVASGVHLVPGFPDPHGLLDTAHADFRHFLGTVGLSAGPFEIVTRRTPTEQPEAQVITVRPGGCEVAAADTEGIRRGLIWVEDEMMRRGGPFLPLGIQARRPWVRTRISRCFYGPINRPPKSKDELADDTDYYPDEYLNRLAHEGVNALWLTIDWFRTVPSRLIPEYGRDSAPRLARLRRTVAKCARYGIRIYPFCIEPAAFTNPAPEVQAAAAAHPELRGHRGSFCTSSVAGLAYVEEAARTLFAEVPGLGGLMVIPVGERQTHCYSTSIPDGGMWPSPNTCPLCSKRQPWEVLRDTLAAMRRGIDAVDPSAELVAWPYGQFIAWGPERTAEAAAHTPPGVILQHNFETGGRNFQLGQWRRTWDYWLSYAGPSELFGQCAAAAVGQGVRVSAKLQVGCSHEVATTQVVPAPGLLYRKYQAMHELGVSSAMHSWYFGSFPSLMTRAAGELSFEPFAPDGHAFLRQLAARDWGDHADQVVSAWEWFEKGYSNYPTAHIFGYFGPMHDGPVWPLYLVPRRLPLAPTWQLGYPPSGDYVAECTTNGFTLRELVVLCGGMTEQWDRGVAILHGLRGAFAAQPERLVDIGLATALGLQLRSGYHILSFYQERETLAEAKGLAARRASLARMKAIVQDELALDAELLPLVEADARLGFHSEAEGYKYYPALIRWRMGQLRRLLRDEFAQVEARLAAPGPLFGDYTGERPTGAVYDSPAVATPPPLDGQPFGPSWAAAPWVSCDHWLRDVPNTERRRLCGYDPCDHLPVAERDRRGRRTQWKALHTRDALYVGVLCRQAAGQPSSMAAFAGDGLRIYIEPRRTLPRRIFHLSPSGAARCQFDDGYLPELDATWRASSSVGPEGWSVVLAIPYAWLGSADGTASPRVNVVRSLPVDSPGSASVSWAERVPLKGRLVWGTLNPATDFGWLRCR